MASKAGSGLKLYLDDVPQRETGMTPYEMMLSESQERMLICVKQGHEAEVEALFQKYGLEAVVIGEVTDDGAYRLYHQEKKLPIYLLMLWQKMRQLIIKKKQNLLESKHFVNSLILNQSLMMQQQSFTIVAATHDCFKKSILKPMILK